MGPSNDSVGNITVMMCTSSIRSEWLTGSWLNDRDAGLSILELI